MLLYSRWIIKYSHGAQGNTVALVMAQKTIGQNNNSYYYYYYYYYSFVPTEVVLRSPGARMDEVAIDISCGMDSTVFITEMGRVFACGK